MKKKKKKSLPYNITKEVILFNYLHEIVVSMQNKTQAEWCEKLKEDYDIIRETILRDFLT